MNRAVLLPILALAALVLLALGIALPLLHIDRLWLFTDSVSLWQAIVTLYAEDETFLAVILTVFSIVFPVLKLLGVLWTWAATISPDGRRGGWSGEVEHDGCARGRASCPDGQKLGPCKRGLGAGRLLLRGCRTAVHDRRNAGEEECGLTPRHGLASSTFRSRRQPG